MKTKCDAYQLVVTLMRQMIYDPKLKDKDIVVSAATINELEKKLNKRGIDCDFGYYDFDHLFSPAEPFFVLTDDSITIRRKGFNSKLLLDLSYDQDMGLLILELLRDIEDKNKFWKNPFPPLPLWTNEDTNYCGLMDIYLDKYTPKFLQLPKQQAMAFIFTLRRVERDLTHMVDNYEDKFYKVRHQVWEKRQELDDIETSWKGVDYKCENGIMAKDIYSVQRRKQLLQSIEELDEETRNLCRLHDIYVTRLQYIQNNIKSLIYDWYHVNKNFIQKD